MIKHAHTHRYLRVDSFSLYLDIGPGDGEDGSRTIRGSRHHTKAAGSFLHEGHGVNDGMAG